MLYSEFFDAFKMCTTDTDRISVLRKNDNLRFRTFLIGAFNPTIKFDVSIPKYTPAIEPAGLNYSRLSAEVDQLYLFVENHPNRPKNLSKQKQENVLIGILERINKDEALLLLKMLNKDLEIPHLNKELINIAFPGLL